jgi:hypothetical protein
MPRASLVALLMTMAACSAERGRRPSVPRGEARLPVPGGSIWYKVSGTGSGTPVVLLHGGPGFSRPSSPSANLTKWDRSWSAGTPAGSLAPATSCLPVLPT